MARQSLSSRILMRLDKVDALLKRVEPLLEPLVGVLLAAARDELTDLSRLIENEAAARRPGSKAERVSQAQGVVLEAQLEALAETVKLVRPRKPRKTA